MQARDLARAVGYDPERTAADWLAASPEFPVEVDWADLLLIALRHRLPGLLLDALKAANWLDMLPVRVYEHLEHFAKTAAWKQRELEVALAELAERHPAEVSRAVLLKGGGTYGLFRSPTHRMMNDFDLLFSGDDYDAVRDTFADLGYWVKESLNGPTYYRRSAGPDGRMCLDMHVIGPSKYSRSDESLSSGWLTETEPFEAGGVSIRRSTPAWHLVNVVSHTHEHLHSWTHAVGEDDLNVVWFLDAELIVAERGADPAEAWQVATDLGLLGEYALGLWAWKQVRGALPAAFAAYEPAIELLHEVGNTAAMPFGRFGTWPVPLAERAWYPEQLELALSLDPSRKDRHWADLEEWYRTRGMLEAEREHPEEIAARARDLVLGHTPH